MISWNCSIGFWNYQDIILKPIWLSFRVNFQFQVNFVIYSIHLFCYWKQNFLFELYWRGRELTTYWIILNLKPFQIIKVSSIEIIILQLIWVCQTASATPQIAARMKKRNFWSGFWIQLKKTPMTTKFRQDPTTRTGIRPIRLMMDPSGIEKIASKTP